MYKERVKENLETTRLRLRKFKLSDKEAVYKYGRDPRTLKYLEWIGVTTREEARISIEEYYLCIGAIDIRLDEANDKASFGYLLDPDYWNQGYMSEVLSRILKHCFEDIRVNRVEAIHYRLNPASGKVMAKCGMKQEGIGIQELKIKGLYHDVVHYAITQEMWQRR